MKIRLPPTSRQNGGIPELSLIELFNKFSLEGKFLLKRFCIQGSRLIPT